MIEAWRKQLKELSGNLTTNQAMPEHLIEKILDEDESLKSKIKFEPIEFPKLDGALADIEGLHILAGLQKNTKAGCLTLFRAIRFPTYKRIYDIVSEHGYAMSNYEQERILECYNDAEYLKKRSEIRNDERFWTQPQERVVHGLPLFCLVNDALQIHRAFRGVEDEVVIVAVHIPMALLQSEKIKLTANSAIDLDFADSERDVAIKNFKTEDSICRIDFRALRTQGVDLHEMFTSDLPLSIEAAESVGITQEFFLLSIQKISHADGKIQRLFGDTKTLLENQYFMHGFFGDQNIFGRRKSTYLPRKCFRLSKRD